MGENLLIIASRAYTDEDEHQVEELVQVDGQKSGHIQGPIINKMGVTGVCLFVCFFFLKFLAMSGIRLYSS